MNAMMQTPEPETARDAVHRLFARDLADGYKLTGLHRYNNADGTELFRVVRLKHAAKAKVIMPMHRDGLRYVAKRPDRPAAGWPLYVPPYPLVEPGPVLIVEGEGCADDLAKRGMMAITSGSASSASAADWTSLRGRHCVLFADHDEPGKKYMAEVAVKLLALGCIVELIDVEALNLPPKGDVVDWLKGHAEATMADVLALPRVAPALPADTSPRVILTRGDAVQPVAVDWLWSGWLAAGKLHLIGGAPGTGKTTIAAALAACVTCGGRWPDGARAERGSVVFWSGEDDVADTLNPRLRAAGADMARVHMVEGVTEGPDRYPFDPARDMDALRLALDAVPNVRLIVIDPIVSAIAGDSHKNAEVRRGLQPLVDLAGQLRCALLGVTHFSKGTAGREPTERITGSLAFGALARLIMVTAKQEAEGDRAERRLMLRAKSNIGPDGGGFVYDLRQGELDGFPGVEASSVQWGEAIHGTARELLAEAEQPDDQGSDAATFLRGLIEHTPVAAKQIKAEALSAGYSMDAMHRAKRKLGAEAVKSGMSGGWFWRLPTGEGGGSSAEDGEDGAQNRPPPSPPSEGEPPPSGTDTEAFDL